MALLNSPLTVSILSAVVLISGLIAAWAVHRVKSLRRFSIPFSILVVAISGRLLAIGYSNEKFSRFWEKALIVGGSWLAVEVLRWLFTRFFFDRVLKLSVEEITKNIISVGLYIAVVLFLLPTVFGIEVTTVLTTSAILTVIIGLALQDLLGNLFAGVALNIEMPFSQGDWVTIGEDIGIVRAISWRTTKIVTMERDLIIIPNSVVARSVVKNLSVPAKRDVLILNMGVAYDASPNLVRSVLKEACARARHVHDEPEPIVRVISYGDFSINYEMRFWIDSYSQYKDARDEVYSLIWYLFKRHGVTIPYPVRDLFIKSASRKEEMERMAVLQDEKARQLRRVSLFSSLQDEDIERLAAVAPIMRYSKGETVVRQGNAGDSFFLIRSGRVRIVVEKAPGRNVDIATLGPEDYFGGMSLLTGEPRNATAITEIDTELLVIDKEMFNDILIAKPEIAEKLGEQLADRQLDREKKLAQAGDMRAPEPTKEQKRQLHERLFRRIMDFFQLK
ncbi:MAG: mechanosensitive ion channel [Candidatus Coatesbacteria bacterium]|nr:mechanosensitive ion channel [Candidatus Coatesbacteria bacterium]